MPGDGLSQEQKGGPSDQHAQAGDECVVASLQSGTVGEVGGRRHRQRAGKCDDQEGEADADGTDAQLEANTGVCVFTVKISECSTLTYETKYVRTYTCTTTAVAVNIP